MNGGGGERLGAGRRERWEATAEDGEARISEGEVQ